MLAIRLQRVGRTNDPSFRIIVQDHRRSPKKTRGLTEYVGSYDARKGKPQINGERVLYWIGQGAQPAPIIRQSETPAVPLEHAERQPSSAAVTF